MAPKKKRDNEVGGKDLSRANWSKENLHLFCDLCIKYAERGKGKHGAMMCRRMPWKTLEVEFRKRTNLAYDRNKLKNKWDWMRSRWSLWKALKGEEMGLDWDHEKGTITASEDWWKKKIEENMHFRAFKDEGIEPELENKMEQLFGVSVDQGMYSHTPVIDCSQGVQCEKEAVPITSPPSLNVGDAPYNCDDEISENNAFNCSLDDMEQQEPHNDHTPIPSPTPLQCRGQGSGSGSKRAFENGASESHKSCRTELATAVGARMLMEKLDSMGKAATDRNIKVMELMSLEARKLVDSSHTLVESLAKIVSMPGLVPGSPEFCFACTLIEDPQKRTILHGIPDDYSRLQWIKFLYEEHRNK
ncbi:uncharacterized protein LOC110683039 [Chenopodium quinoa]|uniref:Myb/SANT-like domain-containing protein n=1 Tax=Chenopodium quinoa TaxID=63459 RepID=A0A803MGC5_CHEQI|nr:uncharacterized protein LOC110683039 [Chenopodium quinoa]